MILPPNQSFHIKTFLIKGPSIKKGMKILFLVVSFFFLAKSYELVGDGDGNVLKNIAMIRESFYREFILYYYYECPEDEEKLHEYLANLLTPVISTIRKRSRYYWVDFENISPRGILDYIFDGSTREEIVGILNQRVHGMFKKWFGEANVVERLGYTPNSDYAMVLYYKIHEEKVNDLTFYSYEFEVLPSEKKSNYGICSYGRDFSNNPFALLTSLVEGMFGDRKGENVSFEGDSDVDSEYIERIKSIVRRSFNASEDQMIIASKYESLLEGDSLRMFCKFKDANNSHVRLILKFIPKSGGGYTFNNALMMFPKGREDITSLKFKNIITSIRGAEE